MERLTLNAPAKINIGLNIIAKRLDGFHNLETFFYPIYDLHDQLIFEKSNSFIFDSDNADLIRDPDNLIIKAHTQIENHINKKLPVKIFLNKNIPIGAGLGGGSSDAAATLVGLNEFFELGIDYLKVRELSIKLGSDVPFFVNSKPAVGYSRGEILHQSNCYIELPILIVNPGIHISTKDAFSNILPKKSLFDYEHFIKTEKLDFSYIKNKLGNDFEESIFEKYSEIENIKTTMYESNAIFSLMSGTGSTVYGIFNNLSDAKNAALKFPHKYYKFISE